MFCTKCGAKCKEDSRFCERCGSPLIPPVPSSRPEPHADESPAQNTLDQVFQEAAANVRKAAEPVSKPVPSPRPVSRPAASPVPQGQRQEFRPVPPPVPAKKKSKGGIIAVAVILLLLAAAGAGAFFVFRTRSANIEKLEKNLARYMQDYCQTDIEDYYDGALPKRFSAGGYAIEPKDSSFRLQPADEKNAFTVSGKFDVTDNTRDDVVCRVGVDGTVTTDFMVSKYTWDLRYDFENPPAIADEDPAFPDSVPAGNDQPAAPGEPSNSVGTMTPAGTAEPGITDPPEHYIWPTDTRYITDSDLALYTRRDIMLMRNELYARYGCSFQDEEIRSYFLEQSWYVPNPDLMAMDFGIENFTDIERTNLDTILSYEKEMGWRK